MKHISNQSRLGRVLRRKPVSSRWRSRQFLWISLLLFPMARTPLSAADVEEQRMMEQKIRLLIHDFSRRMGITQDITFLIVPGNSRLASVECVSRKADGFRISFELGFLRVLDNRELSAAVAHELGHIWIFTHFPYLQTEALANQQALALVTPGDLDCMYEKVWKRNGGRGNLAEILEPAAGIGRRHEVKVPLPE